MEERLYAAISGPKSPRKAAPTKLINSGYVSMRRRLSGPDRTESLQQFQTSPPVMIRAFPKTDLLRTGDFALRVDADEPFAVLSIDQMFVDVIPRLQ